MPCALAGREDTFIGEGPLISPALEVLGPVEMPGHEPYIRCGGTPDASNPSARCSNWICDDHQDGSNDWSMCDICHEDFCSDCTEVCEACYSVRLCEVCAKGRLITCSECEETLCCRHFGGVACDGCQSMFCNECCYLTSFCDECNATLCYACEDEELEADCDCCQIFMCGTCTAALTVKCSGGCERAFCGRPACRAALVGACEACQTQFCELCTCALCGAVPCGCYTIDTLAACSKCQTLCCEGCREEGSCCRQRSAKRRKTVCSMSMEVCATSLGK